ncbi:hypothetical protein [Pseudovibrio sp. Alg231-02]|nr:hypothetical protein [Pseudovibrio sp. Alg231-02]
MGSFMQAKILMRCIQTTPQNRHRHPNITLPKTQNDQLADLTLLDE